MPKADPDIITLERARLMVGKIVASIHRVVYEFQNEVKLDDTPLQITFTDGFVLLLEGASDGEALHISSSPWVDPLGDQEDEAIKEFIRRHGRWKLVNVSDQEPFGLLMGQVIEAVNPIYDQFGILNGIQIVGGGQYLNFVVEWDESHVLWGKANDKLLSRGNVVRPL